MKLKYLLLFSTICILTLMTHLVAESVADETEDLAKESQNPIGNLISVPFENNLNFGIGDENATEYVLNLKPVYPVSLGKVNLINRFIMPFIYQEGRFKGEGDKSGLGDLTYQAFFSPAKPGKTIWGAGPAFILPTNTDDRLGTDKWSAGPAFVILAKPGHWLFGTLVQHFWSYAGDDDVPHVNQSSLQYFINYNFEGGWYLTTSPTIRANWAANSNNTWTVPVGGGMGRLVKFDGLPVDFKLVAYSNVEKPDGGADWRLQLQVKMLFPK
jgi:hypothetical protein